MEQVDKERLRQCTAELVQNILITDFQDILFAKKVLSTENVEELTHLHERSPSKAARKLVLTILPRKGPDAFMIFCEALSATGYQYLVDSLLSCNVENIVVSDVELSCGCHVSGECEDLARKLKAENKELTEKLGFAYREVGRMKSEVSDFKSRVAELKKENSELRLQLAAKDGVDRTGIKHLRRNRSRTAVGDSGLSDMEDALDEVDAKELVGLKQPCTSNELTRIIVTSIIQSVCNEDRPIRKVDAVFKLYVVSMRKAVTSLTLQHGTILEQIADTICQSADDKITVFREYLNDLCGGDFKHCTPVWGRIVACFALGLLFRKGLLEGHDKGVIVEQIMESITSYVNDKLGTIMTNLGGWPKFCQYFLGEQPVRFACVFPPLMLQAVVDQRRMSSGSTSDNCAEAATTKRMSLTGQEGAKLKTKTADEKLAKTM